MKLSRNLSLYWRLLCSYLLVIGICSVTLFFSGETFGPLLLDHHLTSMQETMHNLTPETFRAAMAADLGDAYRRALSQSMLWGLLVSSVVAGGVGLFVTSRIVSPLKSMQRASQQIAAGRYQDRLDAQAPGEVGALAGSFNAMAEALEQTERRRVELLANVAHEFKTPLSSLHGYLDGLEDGVFQADPETVSACQRQVLRLERLVADLSLLSRVETGQEKIVQRPVQACDLLGQVLTAFRPQFEDRGVRLTATKVPASWRVLADAERADQVFSNLVINALRHTPPGGTVQLSARERGRAEIVFEVRDTGEGIAAEDQPHLFTRFFRGDKARQRDQGSGSGIGLTIAKHYVEAQGGQLEVHDEPGWGGVFTFSLPRLN